MRVFLTSFGVLFVLLSALADRGATSRQVISGVIVEAEGDTIRVMNEVADVSVRVSGAVIERAGGAIVRDQVALTPGMRVQVSFNSISSDRHRHAQRVVLED